MTDNLLQKLEDKVIKLLTELDVLRKETSQLKHENAILRAEHANHAQRLQGLVSLLDSLDAVTPTLLSHDLHPAVMEEFAHA